MLKFYRIIWECPSVGTKKTSGARVLFAEVSTGSSVIKMTLFHLYTETAGALRKFCLAERAPLLCFPETDV